MSAALAAVLLAAAAVAEQGGQSASGDPEPSPVKIELAATPNTPIPFAGPAEVEGQRRAMPGTPASLPAVTAQMFQIKGRLELFPMVSVSIGDAFFRTLTVGARGEYHFAERWSVGGHGLFGGSIASTPVAVCGTGICNDPAKDQIRSAPGNLDILLGAQLAWTPIYGKLSLAGEKTIHFDAYVSAGPELLRQRIAQDATSPIETSWSAGARVSLGQRFFLSNTLAIRMAASELLYSAKVRGTGELERQLSLEGGVAWLFGGGR